MQKPRGPLSAAEADIKAQAHLMGSPYLQQLL